MKKSLVLVLTIMLAATLAFTPLVSADPGGTVENAQKFLKENFDLKEQEEAFKLLKEKTDDLGYTHVKLQQMVNGIPVYGSEYIVHFDKEKNIYTSNGKFDIKAKDYKQKGDFIKAEDAIEIAKNDVSYEKGEDDLINAELYLYEVNGEYIPVFLVRVNWLAESSFGDWRVFVDAASGKVVHKYNSIKFGKPTNGTNVIGTGTGVLGDTKTVNLLQSGSTYYLQDMTRTTGGIFTYNAANGTRLPGTLMTDTDAVWNATTQRAAVDAHFYVGKTYDYYKNVLGRDSYDDNNAAIKASVHYYTNYVNAFWDGRQIVFGDGDGYNSLALSGGLDIIAHELTHAVDSYEADLIYQNQSGALSESFSDVMATAVEFYAQPSHADWLMGEDVWTPGTPNDALRSLSNPSAYGDPEHMDDYYYTTSDNGGVHTNCGIPNKAAYLVGNAIGADKMGKIYYRALSTYLVSSSDFSACRVALLQSATDLYGSNGTEYNAIVNAFNAVGIY